jgi:hypothetical protein
MRSTRDEDRPVEATTWEFTNGKDLAFFGSPPLVPGEDAHAYDELLTMVTERVKPADVLEAILVRDYVDLQWELQRLRRIKADLISTCTEKDPLDFFGAASEGGSVYTLSERLPSVDRLDRMTALAEVRRNNARRELESYRANAAARPRRLSRQIEDAEYHVIDERSGTEKPVQDKDAS